MTEKYISIEEYNNLLEENKYLRRQLDLLRSVDDSDSDDNYDDTDYDSVDTEYDDDVDDDDSIDKINDLEKVIKPTINCIPIKEPDYYMAIDRRIIFRKNHGNIFICIGYLPIDSKESHTLTTTLIEFCKEFEIIYKYEHIIF